MGEKIKIVDSILLAEDVQKEVKRRLAGGMGDGGDSVEYLYTQNFIYMGNFVLD